MNRRSFVSTLLGAAMATAARFYPVSLEPVRVAKVDTDTAIMQWMNAWAPLLADGMKPVLVNWRKLYEMMADA